MHRAECPGCRTSYPLDRTEKGERLVIQCAVCKTWMNVNKRFGGWRFPRVTRRGAPQPK